MRDDNKKETKAFLDGPFQYTDEYYVSHVVRFHDRIVPGDASNTGDKSSDVKKFRKSLQDETMKRLYRLFIKLAEMGNQRLPIIGLVADGLTKCYDPCTTDDVDNMFFNASWVWPWRKMDIWSEKYDPKRRDYPEGYPKGEDALEITLHDGSEEYDSEFSFRIPLCWLTEKFINDPSSDKRINVICFNAAVEEQYRKLFFDRTFAEKAEILHLIADYALTESIEHVGAEDNL